MAKKNKPKSSKARTRGRQSRPKNAASKLSRSGGSAQTNRPQQGPKRQSVAHLSGGSSRQIVTRFSDGTYETLAALIRQGNEYLLQRLSEQQEHLFRTFLGGVTSSIASNRPLTTASQGNAELPRAIDDISRPQQVADGGPSLPTTPQAEPQSEPSNPEQTYDTIVRVTYQDIIEASERRPKYKYIDFLYMAYVRSAFEGSEKVFKRKWTGWSPNCAQEVRDYLLTKELLHVSKESAYTAEVIAKRTKSKNTKQINSVQLTKLGKAVVELGLKEAADGRSPFTADT